ncbi:MAG: ATP-binding protein [Mariprofundus sp.]
MMQLIAYRMLAGALIALVLWVYPSVPFHVLIQYTGWTFLLLLLLQIALVFSRYSERLQLLFYFVCDTLLASCLIFATGGIDSPFSFLLGLIIIFAGNSARLILPLIITVLACAGYLVAVYSALWLSGSALPSAAQALYILLQVSALMLVGGVMAAIAKRHAHLRASSDQAQTQNRKLRDLHDKLMAAMCEGVIVLDQQLQLSDMNGAAATLLAGQPVSVLTAIPAIDHCLHREGKPSCQCEYHCGERTWLVAATHLTDASDAAWLLTLVDISDVRSMEQQMHQQEKMAALGQMAAMLAHGIRNPIHTIAQGLEMLPVSEVNGISIRDILHEEVLRLNRLVTTMLDYAQPLQPKPDFSHMPSVIRAAGNQMKLCEQRSLDVHCRLEQLFLDGDHFRLVLDNLLDNAQLNSPAGSIIRIDLDSNNGGWRLQVSNEGRISEAVRENLFKPFVSGSSSGIGLGLATVQQVCDMNGWRVNLITENDRVCFVVNGAIAPDEEEEQQWVLAHG